MRKIYKSLLIGALLVLVLALFLSFILSSRSAVSLKSTGAQTKRQPYAGRLQGSPRTAETQNPPLQTEQAQARLKQDVREVSLLEEFPLSPELTAELQEAIDNGEMNVVWGHGRISGGELQAAGVTFAQLSEQVPNNQSGNISAGYNLPDESFAESLQDALPEEALKQDEQTSSLNSEALSAMAFSALMEHNQAQAQAAFSALIQNYPDSQAAPMAHLELARLFFEEGRLQEAEQLVDKAVILYAGDKEYLEIARDLEEELQSNE